MTKVFISHSSHNRKRAEKLAQALRKLKMEVWYDEWNILVGHNLLDQIYEGIRKSDYLVVILTKASIKSKWVKRELDAALIHEIEAGGTKVIPLLFEKCQIPTTLKTKAYADFTISFEKGLAQLRKTLIDENSRNLGAKLDLSFADILGALYSCRKLMYLPFHYVHEGTSPKKSAIKELRYLRNDVKVLSSLAKRFDIDARCYNWLDDFLKGFVCTETQAKPNISARRKNLDLWFRGRMRKRGGLA